MGSKPGASRPLQGQGSANVVTKGPRHNSMTDGEPHSSTHFPEGSASLSVCRTRRMHTWTPAHMPSYLPHTPTFTLTDHVHMRTSSHVCVPA